MLLHQQAFAYASSRALTAPRVTPLSVNSLAAHDPLLPSASCYGILKACLGKNPVLLHPSG